MKDLRLVVVGGRQERTMPRIAIFFLTLVWYKDNNVLWSKGGKYRRISIDWLES